MIKDNKPYTCEKGQHDFDLLSDGDTMGKIPDKAEFQKIIFDWIDSYISPSKYTYNKESSYSFKHKIENWADRPIYLTNNQFKDAMMQKGYMPVNEDEVNWRFKIKFNDDKENDQLLQQKLFPVQNLALFNWIKKNYPNACYTDYNGNRNVHHYINPFITWHFSHVLGKVIINACMSDGSNRKRLELPCVKL